MKLLIAFALFAVAFADEIRVVPLPLPPLFSMPSMGQVIVPNYIIDAVKVGMPVMRDEIVVFDDEGLKVHFVDAPLDVAAPEFSLYGAVQIVDVPEPVRLGEAPLPAFETAESAPDAVRVVDVAPVAEEIAVESVRIAEPTLPVVASVAEDIVPEPVQIAEAPLPAFETADVNAVKFVDAPIAAEIAVESVRIAEPTLPEVAPAAEKIVPEPVQIAEAPLPAFETADVNAVKFVDAPIAAEIAVESVRIAEPSLPVVASVAEEIVPEPVQIAEAPLPAIEAAEIDAVRFVDAPLDVAAPESNRLAEPAVPAFETAPAVEAVKIAMPQFRDYRVKQFEDPRLR